MPSCSKATLSKAGLDRDLGFSENDRSENDRRTAAVACLLLASRDPKGLWAASRARRLHGFTGVDAPYAGARKATG